MINIQSEIAFQSAINSLLKIKMKKITFTIAIKNINFSE